MEDQKSTATPAVSIAGDDKPVLVVASNNNNNNTLDTINTTLNRDDPNVPSPAVTSVNSGEAKSGVVASAGVSSSPPSTLPPRNPTHKVTGGGVLKPQQQQQQGVVDGKPLDLGAGSSVTMDTAAPNEGRTNKHDVELGEAPPPDANMNPYHSRKVSWGDYNHLVGGIPTIVQPAVALKPNRSPTQSPPMNDSNSYFEDVFTGLGSPHVSPRFSNLDQPVLGSPKSSQSTAEQQIANLNDLLKVNPLESEAETLILKAIEKQDAILSNRARSNTAESSNLLGNIPAASIDVFRPPAAEPNCDPQNSATSSRPPLDHSAKSIRQQVSPKQQQQQKQPLPKPSMQRNQTMEQKLAGLSSAMAMAGFHGGSVDGNRRPGGGDAAMQSAGEALAQNADMVFRVYPPKLPTVEPVIATTTTEDASSKNNWARLRTTVRSSGGGGGGGGGEIPKDDSVQNGSVQSATASNTGAAVSKKRWGVLKTAVILAGTTKGTMEDHKKTDDECTDQNNDPAAIQGDDLEYGSPPHLDPEMETPQESGSVATDSGHYDMDDPKKGRKKHRSKHMTAQIGAAKDFQIFVVQRRGSFFSYLRFLLLVVCPALAVSFILYYLTGNKPTGRVDPNASANGILVNESGNIIDPNSASASWWILFVCVRQALTFSLSQLLQVFIIDFLCLNTRFVVNVCGNLLTLLIVQSKGWPFIAVMWGIWNFALLHGSSSFAAHWLYWQDYIDIFNQNNPSGTVTDSIWNTRALSIAVSVGVVVSMKRLWLGLYLGKKTFANHAEDLANVVQKAVILCEVASLARTFQIKSFGGGGVRRTPSLSKFGMSQAEFDGIVRRNVLTDDDIASGEGISNLNDSIYSGGLIIDPSNNDPRRGTLDQSQRMKINELLGAWDEPEAEVGAEENVSISGILQFRHSLSFLDNNYMFSIAWGDVSTRDRMVVSSQDVYKRLLLCSPDASQIKFDIFARTAERSDGTLDEDKLKDLIRLFRPDRDGNLSLLDFVRSVDGVYKEAKLLRASVRNSEKIDRAFENAFNLVFFTIITCVTLSQLGFDPLALFLSLSSLILAFAFMIGSASSKMFEGFLFILIRRPYNIGDRIHISNPESDTSGNGSSSWIVKDVTLFHTTAVFASTGEKATLSNGSLASSRVINMARSPNAFVYINLKFSTSIPFEKIQIFEQALRQFVKARPREWNNFSSFRATQIVADLGYTEYVVSLQHREAWQNINAVLESKAQVASFCLELSKKLEMRYQSPALPVDLAFVNRGNAVENESIAAKFAALAADDSSGLREVAALFDK